MDDFLKTNTDPRFKHLLGKKVEFISQGVRYIGILDFAGINHLHGQFQVTATRTPIWPVDPETIKLFKL